MPIKSSTTSALQAEVRGLKIRTTLALAVAAIALGIAWAGNRSTRVVAESVALRDAEGRARAVLELDDDGAPRLVFYDEAERRRVQLGLAPGGGAGLVVTDAQDHPRLALGATDDGPQLSLFDEHGALRALLGAGTATDTDTGEQLALPATFTILDSDGHVLHRVP